MRGIQVYAHGAKTWDRYIGDSRITLNGGQIYIVAKRCNERLRIELCAWFSLFLSIEYVVVGVVSLRC
jgi:hypothetical protein